MTYLDLARRALAALAAIASLCGPGTAWSAPGDFDPAFGRGGAFVSTSSEFLFPGAAETDALGRIWVVGTKDASGRLAVGRLLPSGQVDSSFGANGVVLLQENEHLYQEHRRFVIRQDSQGRIIVGAPISGPSANGSPQPFHAAVYRFLGNGSLDASFATGGVLRFRGTQGEFIFYHLAIDRQDRILLAGANRAMTVGEPALPDVVRLLPSGQVDASFGVNGGLSPASSGYPNARTATALAIDAADRIIVGYQFHHPLRFSAGGQLDAAFAGEVTKISQSELPLNWPNAIHAEPDGSLVLALRTWSGPNSSTRFVGARLLANGRADTSYGANGALIAPEVGMSYVIDGLLDASGRSVQVGTTRGRSLYSGDYLIARFTAQGRPDTAFATAGTRAFDVLDADDVRDVHLDPQGRIVIVGSSFEYGQQGMVFIMRFLSDESPAGADNTPDPFFIRSFESVALNTRVSFPPVLVSGINVPTGVSIQNGQFCVSQTSSCGCEVVPIGTRATTVLNGQFVCPYQQSAATGSTKVDSMLTIGTLQASFNSTTVEVAAPTYSIGADTWWNASESGWGIVLRQTGSLLLGGLYVYNTSGQASWYTVYCNVVATGCTGDLVSTSGPALGSSFDPSQVTRTTVGSIAFTFTGVSSANLRVTIIGTTRNLTVTRQQLITSPATGTDYSDLWWNPAESGWGLNMTHRGLSIFSVWYGYSETGQPLWLTSICSKKESQCAGDLLESTGPPFAQTFDPSRVVRNTVGRMTLNFTGTNTATMEYSIRGRTYTRNIQRF